MSGPGAGKGGDASGPAKPQALGAVQQAFGGTEKGYDKAWEAMTTVTEFNAEFGDFLEKMPAMEKKLLSIRTLIPVARAKILTETEATNKKRSGILEGYRGKAAGKGIPWKEGIDKLNGMGLDYWEKKREECTDKTVVNPAYWEIGGKGTLHSYEAGNCCWEAAFDVTCGAYELVHSHHFPEVPAQECFFKLHRELDSATIDALNGGPAKVVVDIGCGSGTSTFSLRETLNSRGLTSANITGIDLSPYFIALARWRLDEGDRKGIEGKIDFIHGNGLRVKNDPNSVDIFMASALTHELPTVASEQMVTEAARVLRPGGVFGYFDLNPVQLLRDNPVSNIVDRVAIANEPFMDEFLAFDLMETLKAKGLDLVTVRSTNPTKWPNWHDCPCYIVIARKPEKAA